MSRFQFISLYRWPHVLLVLVLVFIPSSLEDLQIPNREEECSLCIFQRDSSLVNITYRAITGDYNGPEEETFGHCFFCLTCAGIDDTPCYGWWPKDPDGGDYEGDEGALHPDAKEPWQTAQCISISQDKAEEIMTDIDEYEQHHRYQVLNSNGTSCLGFCTDILKKNNTRYSLPFGYLSLSGSLYIPSAFVRVRSTDYTPPSTFMNSISTTTPNHSQGMLWNKAYFEQHRVKP